MLKTFERLLKRRPEACGDGGFTLIELLVVIVIMGVLAGVVVFAVQSLGGTSVLAACQSDLKTVETAVESYKVQMGNYPDGTGGAGSIPPVTDGDSSQAGIVNAVGVEQGTTTLLSGQQLGSELLTGSENGATSHDFQGRQTLNRAMSPSVGPWLKDLPQNGTYYYIWVSNDGKGTILVGKGSVSNGQPSVTNTSCLAAGIGS